MEFNDYDLSIISMALSYMSDDPLLGRDDHFGSEIKPILFRIHKHFDFQRDLKTGGKI